MNQDIAGNSGYPDKKINPEQFDQVVEAILAGKYSWACVLMLRFVGYNPLHYIPYRTYNRLIKENSRNSRSNPQPNENLKIAKTATEKRSDSPLTPSCLSRKIKDIAYLEVGGQQKAEVRNSHREKKLA
ncbi:HetP family heterocyst commitment protein [Anabaena sp. UHCC 0451]|uniref:HetP family heterocyst commitment protein n=1 Tax=Anabaena sp. UHCC 0451 TaxID=2055235 RepID=UPI002B209ABE|nr:HetP family heterocyst commitment protein [Anabaena sp. UHCC 0451]MEA5575277.1 HetP family heterocyst commitment protein [Anabaena sp. UHCC 0451]